MSTPSSSKVTRRYLTKAGGLNISSKEVEIFWSAGSFHVEFVYWLQQSTFNARFMQGLESQMKKEALGLAKEWAASPQFAEYIDQAGKPEVEHQWTAAAGHGELVSRMLIHIRSPGLMNDDPLGTIAAVWFKRRGFKPSIV